MAATPVKYWHSGMTGAPQITYQTAGSFLGVLNACLVDGFGQNTVDSVAITANVATVTRAAGHPFEVDTTTLIAGATTSDGTINGEQRVLSITATSYTFATTGVSNQTATGTITHKFAPAGWTKPFADASNVGVFAPSDVTANVWVFRMSDTEVTAGVNVNVSMYDSMTDVNTGTRQWPAGGATWAKHSGSYSHPWLIAADSRSFLLYNQYRSEVNGKTTAFVGDFLPMKGVDAFSVALGPASLNNVLAGSDLWVCGSGSSQTLSKAHTGVGAAIGATQKTFTLVSSTTTSSGAVSGGQHMPWPNTVDNGLYLNPMMLFESTNLLRGRLPGAYYAPHDMGGAAFTYMERVSGVLNLSGRTLLAIPNGVGAGFGFFDVTGPWR